MYQPAPYAKLPDKVTRTACLQLVRQASAKWNVPPAHITSHMRGNGATAARRWVMLQMLETLGMKRCQVAWAFAVDLRRVRASEIGGKRVGNGRRGGDKFRRVDLLGFPLETPREPKRSIPYRVRFMEAVEILKMASRESEIARKFVRMFDS